MCNGTSAWARLCQHIGLSSVLQLLATHHV